MIEIDKTDNETRLSKVAARKGMSNAVACPQQLYNLTFYDGTSTVLVRIEDFRVQIALSVERTQAVTAH